MNGEELQSEQERRILKRVMLINFFFFGLEITAGWLAGSMGLLADSLDMLADSIVYALALYAVSRSVKTQRKLADAAGYFQLLLAVAGLAEAFRRFFLVVPVPMHQIMIIISLLSLAGNIISLILLRKVKDGGAHMHASFVFTTNDIVVNAGVILAGTAVYYTSSGIPDLVAGILIFLFVVRGAIIILKS